MTTKVSVTVYLDRDLRDRARQTGLSFSHELSRALDQHFRGEING